MTGSWRPKVLLWDLDGTLAYWTGFGFIPPLVGLFVRALPGKPFRPWALLATAKAYIRVLRNRGPVKNDALFNETLSRSLGVSPSEICEISRRVLGGGEVMDLVGRFIRPIPEALDLVERVRNSGGMRQIVATNPVMPSCFTRDRLAKAGYNPGSFEHFSGSEDHIGQKKEPRFFQELLSLKGLSPEDCLMIGNDVRKDLFALKSGVRTFLMRTRFLQEKGWPEGLQPTWAGGYDLLAKILGVGG